MEKYTHRHIVRLAVSGNCGMFIKSMFAPRDKTLGLWQKWRSNCVFILNILTSCSRHVKVMFALLHFCYSERMSVISSHRQLSAIQYIPISLLQCAAQGAVKKICVKSQTRLCLKTLWNVSGFHQRILGEILRINTIYGYVHLSNYICALHKVGLSMTEL